MVAGPTAASAEQSGNGKAITASHVVSACGTGSPVTVTGPAGVSLLQNDVTHDLAVLSISGELEPPLAIESALPHVGEQIALLGDAHQEPEVTQGTITAVNLPQTLEGEGSTETLSDSIQVQTSSIAGESGGPAIDAAGQVVGVIEGGSQTGSYAVLTPISDLPAGATDAPPRPAPTTTTTTTSVPAPSTTSSPAGDGCNCGVQALPIQCGYGVAGSSGMSCAFANNAFYEYWEASGRDPSQSENITVWSPDDQQFYALSCGSGDGAVDCTGTGSSGASLDAEFTQQAVSAYTNAEAAAYTASGKLGPSSTADGQ